MICCNTHHFPEVVVESTFPLLLLGRYLLGAYRESTRSYLHILSVSVSFPVSMSGSVNEP